MEPIGRRYFGRRRRPARLVQSESGTDMQIYRTSAQRPRVVIIGAGFAGLSAAKGLADAPVDVTVVDRHNYHLFQPLLYQVATAALSPGDIASPIRSILCSQANTTVMLAKVCGIDLTRNEVILS